MEQAVDRRQLLGRGARLFGGMFAVGAAGVWLDACGSSGTTHASSATTGAAKSLGTVRFQLVWIKNVQFAGSYLADTRGYFKQEGVGVEILAGGPSVIIEPLVVQGTVQIGITGAQAAADARNKGADLVIVAAGYQKNPECIISLAKNPIMTPRDMIGKKIGVPADSVSVVQAFLKANSIAASAISIVPVQFDPTPLAAGQVDGYFGFYSNEPTILKLKGVETHVMLLNDFGLPQLAETYIVSRSTLKDPAQRAKIVAFLRGEIRGWQDYVAKPQDGADLAINVYGKALGLDAKEQSIEAVVQTDLVTNHDTDAHGLLWMSDESIDQTVRSLAVSGTAANRDLFDTSVLQEVYGGKNRL
jgi:ABC-type nitrate/sulfonate/bicarbonate transport system substrate-binding protein